MSDKMAVMKKYLISLIFLSMGCGFTVNASGSPLWRTAVNKDQKLYGHILIADEKGTYWDDRLPGGWAWQRDSQSPGAYYFNLNKITPKEEGDRIILEISRWDFCNSALQEGFSNEAVARKILALQQTPGIRFHEDIDMAESRREYDEFGEGQAEELLTEARKDVDFSIAVKGAIVLRTTSKRLYKVFVENYSTTGYISAVDIPRGIEGERSPETRTFVRSLEHGWRLDLDRDGLVDLIWNPISHIRSSYFEVRRGHRIALIKIYGR